MHLVGVMNSREKDNFETLHFAVKVLKKLTEIWHDF